LYDYRPQARFFPSSGLQVLGWYTANWLRKEGHIVIEDNLFGSVIDPRRTIKPDMILWIGFWGDSKYVPIIDEVKRVGYIVTDGQIPPSYRTVLNEMDGVIALSKKCEDILRRDGIKNVQMAYPGIDLTLFKPQKMKKRFFYIFSHWIHASVDGDRALLEAMPSIIKKYPDTKLIFKIQYEQTKEHFQWAKPYILNNNLKDNVYFLSELEDYKNMGRYYQRADLYVSPGGIIGFEFPFVESNACGLPVVGLDAGTAPEIIQDGYNGLLCKTYTTKKRTDIKMGLPVEETYLVPSADEVAEKVKSLIGSQDLYSSCSKNAVESSKKWSIEVRIKDLSKILETI
jgi:glycosyltransferase involved in cell wall biosynthesis